MRLVDGDRPDPENAEQPLAEAEAHGDVVPQRGPRGEVVPGPGLAAVSLHPQAR